MKESVGREVTATDFKIAGNTVTKVTKGNFDTVYTLTLGTSLDGKAGSLNVNGVEAAYNFQQLKVESAKAKNLRQLEVKFSAPISTGAIVANADGTYTMDSLLNNLHIWLTKEEVGTTATNSIAGITGANSTDWTAIVSADKKTVTIQSKDGSKLTDAKATGLDLKLNEEYQVEALNVVDANGKYSDVSAALQLLTDTVRPTAVVASPEVFTATQGTTPANTLTLNFGEPIKDLKTTDNVGKVYIDGILVPNAAITDVTTNGSVLDHSQIKIATDATTLGFTLNKGEHKVTVVGVEDINGNIISNNNTELTFKVVDPSEVVQAEPQVKEVVQIADNAFKVVFTTSGVTPKTTTAGDNILTIANGAYDSSAYTDMNFTYADFVTSGTAPANGKVTAVEVAANPAKGIVAHTEWVVITTATATEAAAQLSYRGANVVTRDIKVVDFKNTSKDGKAVTKSLQFKKDTAAPVVSSKSNAIKQKGTTGPDARTIVVGFSDAPFELNGNGEIVLPGSAKKVTVKYTDENGVTYSEEVTPSLTTDKKGIELALTTGTKLVTSSGELIKGATYDIVLPDGVVLDSTENNLYQLLDGAHPFVGRTVQLKLAGDQVAGDVPQTTRGLIFTAAEVANSVGTYATAVKNQNKLVLNDNQIVVVFEGSVDATTVKNSTNYTLGGKVLPTGTTIEYRESDIDADALTTEKFALITLPSGSVTLTGGQDFTVSGIANKSGNKMLPVADTIQLTDNTAPVATNVQILDSNKLVVIFNEEITVDTTDMTQLATNFVITANGKVVGLANAVKESKNRLVITTADNFDNAGSLEVPASVQIKVNNDGNLFVSDNDGNKAQALTVTKK